MKIYTYRIDGMTCHACESLITMDLEDAGLPKPESISATAGEVKIGLEESQVESVRAAIESSGKYTVTSIV